MDGLEGKEECTISGQTKEQTICKEQSILQLILGKTCAPNVGNGSEMASYKDESIQASANKATDNALFYHSLAIEQGRIIISHLFFNIMYIIGHLGKFLRLNGAISYRGGWGQKGWCHTGNSINPHIPLHVSASELVVWL